MKQTEKTKLTVLDTVIKIYEELEGSKLEQEALLKVSEELNMLQNYLGCSQIQAAFFSIIFSLQNKDGEAVSFHKITDYLDESFLYLIKYKKDINSLIKENTLYTAENEFNRSDDSSYLVNKNLSNCIIENLPYEKENSKKQTPEIISDFDELIWDYIRHNISPQEYSNLIKEIEERNECNELIKNVTKIYPNEIEERIFIYHLSYRLINGSDYQDEDDSEGFNFKIFPSKNLYTVKEEIEKEKFKPLKDLYVGRKLVANDMAYGRRRRANSVFSLTQKGLDTFFGKEAALYEAEESVTNTFDKLKQFLLEFANTYEMKKRSQPMKVRMLRNLEKKYSTITFIKKVSKLIPEEFDRFIFYDCCNDFVVFNNPSGLVSTLEDIYGQNQIYFKKVHEYKDEEAFLLKEGFLILDKNENINKASLSLSDRAYELLYGKNADLFVRTFSDNNVMSPEKMKEKTLFYPQEIVKQVEMLKKSLENNNLIAMQKRLEAKALPKGIAVLLYGAAGTGKTESVYQIAKATNRKIYHVDISETKSMWFGESEKLIKKVFTNYKNLCKDCVRHKENTPILLFNEADAIISKRKSVDSGNVAQTENAIQNIILEQMESLEGIMIATTNLCENMDKAFERRFLFKIKFDKPGVKERTLIWKDKLSLLSDEDAGALARQFDFSGGEIDNIVRKCEIDEIITGQEPKLSKIEELCKFERLSTQESRTMGFTL
ncbi:MAG: ATP-binding protein [Treponema sp.]|nr:ATP-binding protein [Treponema sp.]